MSMTRQQLTIVATAFALALTTFSVAPSHAQTAPDAAAVNEAVQQAPAQPAAPEADAQPATPEAQPTPAAETTPAAPTAQPTASNSTTERTTSASASASAKETTASRTKPTSRDFLYEISQLPFLSVASLRVVTGLLGLPGLNLINLGNRFAAPVPADYPRPVDRSIKQVSLISREVAPVYPRAEERRLERWTIASPSMGRNILVDVRLPKPTGEPTPTLVMLDGVEAPAESGWLNAWNGGEFDRVFGDENVTVVFPLEAPGSWYSDWQWDDPKLGRQKWETFITKELLPVIDAQSDINSNGKRAIGGLSMGATGAVHIANQHPDKFDAVFGISGCYSTMDSIGRQTTLMIPQTRGGRPERYMWGSYGSAEWRRHDVTLNPSGLRNQAVYLSTATGGIPLLQYYSDDPDGVLQAGWALEAGTYQCTRDLEASMKKRGMNHQKVTYKDRGTHSWDNFRAELAPAWAHVRSALF